jgi:hypothetical protein
MKTEFLIYKGSISFPGNQIMIRDDSNKWTRWLSTASSVATIIVGAYITGRSLVVSPGEISWFGLATIAVGLLSILIGTRISADGELDAGLVEKAVISHDFAGYLNVTFHLSNSRKRKAVLDYNDEDKFEKFYLKEFVEALNGRAIRTEIR